MFRNDDAGDGAPTTKKRGGGRVVWPLYGMIGRRPLLCLFPLAIQYVAAWVALSRPRHRRSVFGHNVRSMTVAFNEQDKDDPPHFVVVGGGWAGWGAAKAFCEAGAKVTLFDALSDPRTPYTNENGKVVEAGFRGFWMDYPNINSLCSQLNLTNVFTEFTNSSFYSPEGLEATAPVFSAAGFPKNDLPFLSQLSGRSVDSLPSPLGQVLATFPLFERLPLQDRASMVGLLLATVDCFAADEATKAKYDRMTAHELFRVFGLSERLVNDFLKPTLLVGLFKPPTELSALVVMELLYYYALAHVNSFDVRWMNGGSVSSRLIGPLADYLEATYPLFTLKSRSPITKVETKKGMVVAVESKDGTRLNDIDGLVLAVSSNGMRSIVSNSPDLAAVPMFSKAASCPAIDVISVRLWLDTTVPTRTPANVLANFDELRGAGGTFFMLDQLQKTAELWGNDEPQGSVLACDFYNAGALLPLSDDQIVKLLLDNLLPAAVPAFADANTVDSWVGRYPNTVTWFSPGSLERRPTIENGALSNLKCAGDWVNMQQYEHGAKGLCQERAYVSGLQAANLLLSDNRHRVLPVRDDEAGFKAAIEFNRNIMKLLPPRPWLR
jgi:uncharacterized protein with NAD-binding domain and iron-sulfur cluster